ncbi:MAG: hypothetical protein ACI8W7_000267, partial [Gammaproteobacteria bacterium]
PTSNAASEAGIVADNSRHSRHPWRSMQRRANGTFILTEALTGALRSSNFSAAEILTKGSAQVNRNLLFRSGAVLSLAGC